MELKYAIREVYFCEVVIGEAFWALKISRSMVDVSIMNQAGVRCVMLRGLCVFVAVNCKLRTL